MRARNSRMSPMDGLIRGAIAGLVGGLVFGASMLAFGTLASVASLVGAASPLLGFLVHMAIAALVGASFGLLVCRHEPSAAETLNWGLIYGALWWFLGPLTLMPLILAGELTWSVTAAQDALPSLFGHLGYGLATALAFGLLALPAAEPERERKPRVRVPGGIGLGLRGGVAGVIAVAISGWALAAQGELAQLSGGFVSQVLGTPWPLGLLVGVLVGVTFARLHPDPLEGSGVALIRGALFGFLAWGVLALTGFPLIQGEGLAWTLAETRTHFPGLIGYLLFGALLGLFHQWLAGLRRLVAGSPAHDPYREGPGTEALRAIGRGAWAGIVGGLIFTLVMAQTGILPSVAQLVGAQSVLSGFLVHLVIAILIGASYGLLFRGRSYDRGSALGWGVAYGFVWWILGGLTLMPTLLGTTPDWTASGAAQLAASLIGHLAYGAALGLAFYAQEARHDPWWMPRSAVEAKQVAFRKAQVLTAAPALWALLAILALVLPVLLGAPSTGS